MNDAFYVCQQFILFTDYFLILQQGLSDRLNSPVVFAHNDLLSGNIMINNEEGNIP